MTNQAPPAILAAGKWYALLSSGAAQPEDFQKWQTWRGADPQNEQAWAQVEALGKQFSALPANVNSDILLEANRHSRRRILKQLALVIGVGAISALGYQQKPWRPMLADQSTATGEVREITLADGSHLFIQTNSAVNLVFNDHSCTIELIRGEIYVETAHSGGAEQPRLTATTRHGRFVALGTKFNLRDHGAFSQVSVYEGKVEISPQASGHKQIVAAGQSGKINNAEILAVDDSVVNRAWIKGMLIVFDMPLPEFVQELARYHTGIMRCDPALATLKVSGNFRITDIDAILQQLPTMLPVRVEKRTRYWISVTAA